MKSMRQTAKHLLRRLLVMRAQGTLRQMAQTGIPGEVLLAEALRKAFRGLRTPDEQRWVRAIETLRVQLDASTEIIEIVDFGAGDPIDSGEATTRTEDEMVKGVTEATTVGAISRISKYELWALMLFHLVSAFKPAVVVELGTAVGISAAYQAAALKLYGGTGKVITLEGAPVLAELSQRHLASLGLDNVDVVCGRFQDTLSDVLEAHRPIDIAFIDGHHDGDATVGYFQQFLPYLADRAVLVFDDIFYYKKMRQAWERIADDPAVHCSVDLTRMGICLIEAGRRDKTAYRMNMI